MSSTARKFDQFPDRWAYLDPTGEVYLAEPSFVEEAIHNILGKLYGNAYDAALLSKAIEDLAHAYRGEYPGLLRCDTLYHDLRHALETGLTTARLLDGYAQSLAAGGKGETVDADHALLTVLLALFHDIGLQRRDTEGHLWGPVLIPIHEERGVEFMEKYLLGTSLAPLAEKSFLIMPTKLIFSIPDSWSDFEHTLGGIIASADLLSQMADRYYLEKCRDFLFVEFSAIGIAGAENTPYPDRETLLSKTPGFFSMLIQQRLEKEFRGVHRLIELHTGGSNPWLEAIQRNIDYLKDILDSKDFSRLQRRPKTFI